MRPFPAVRVCLFRLCLIVLAWANTGAAGHTAPCDARLVPITGDLGYRPRDGEARCEGLYRSQVSGASLELVSLMQGSPRFDLLPDVTLRVLCPRGVEDLAQGVIHVRAVALPLRAYYRLDGVVSPKRPMAWPVADVLLPAKLAATQIGVFGWTETDMEKLFVPLRVIMASNPGPPGPIRLTIRPISDLETILWRSYPDDPRPVDLPAWAEAAGSTAAGRTVSVVLPDGPAGILRVEFAAKNHGSDRWSSLRLRILRPATR